MGASLQTFQLVILFNRTGSRFQEVRGVARVGSLRAFYYNALDCLILNTTVTIW